VLVCECISHSKVDQAFADRLYADLRQKGIRCWLATKDLKIGDKFHTRINEAIRTHDKLLVILSRDSIGSKWVEVEVAEAFDKETKDRTVLFPIRLDDAVLDCDEAWAKSVRQTRHIGDFSNSKDHDEYTRSLERLVHDLRSETGSGRKAAATLTKPTGPLKPSLTESCCSAVWIRITSCRSLRYACKAMVTEKSGVGRWN
jgi:hypothetical protein